jgi:hypothetical protein
MSDIENNTIRPLVVVAEEDGLDRPSELAVGLATESGWREFMYGCTQKITPLVLFCPLPNGCEH